MAALLLSFVAALLAEWGDKTQLLVIALAARYRRPAPILAGVAVAALANAALAAFAGSLIHGLITLRALSLLIALALVFAGVSGFIRQKQPDMGRDWRTGPFVTTAACFFLLEFADKTQFLTFAVAAQYDSFVLATLGATAGVAAASVPSALLGDKLPAMVPTKGLRYAIASLLLLAGLIVGVNAWRLI